MGAVVDLFDGEELFLSRLQVNINEPKIDMEHAEKLCCVGE